MSIFKKMPTLLEAIEEYSPYTKQQRELLKLLVILAVDGVVTIGTPYLAERTGLSRPSVYLNLNKFCRENLLVKVREPGARQDSYQIQEEKFERILQVYNNKKLIKNS